jgi:hypothetical protein
MASNAPPARPAWVRRSVAAFLVAFALCGVLGLEAWPLTGWRLFADARRAEQAGWQAVAVDPAGREQPIVFAELPAGFHGNVQVLKSFPALTPARQAATCDAWAQALRARGAEVAQVRVYATSTDLAARRGDRGAPPVRRLAFTCRLGQGPAGVSAGGDGAG